ncbi:MAG: D-alanyl-D-alanine carboxypeptidase family protein [Polymorphobacter sp.]|uniref:D-alanyl-D-alanine carboxypeptidase family protein n=1 Tax=Polymorphobacter sp. TaxID=1909290 RepID=UPI003A8BAA6B
MQRFLLLILLLFSAPVRADSLYDVPKYAAILINAESGEVLYARRADEQRFPASITKVMSLYLAFEDLKAGRIKETDEIRISRHAASQPPTKLGLRAGETITVADAIGVMAVRSANDISVALAEHLAGSEAKFAARMNATAKRLGMTATHFVNPHGLPNKDHVTTARDLVQLSRAMIRDFPTRYGIFAQPEFQYRDQIIKGHNYLLKVPGVDGIKTGFTNASGFTLAASAVHDGVRLIAIVLGSPTRIKRDDNMTELLDTGFKVLTRRSRGEMVTVAANFAEPDDLSDAMMDRLATLGPASGGLVLPKAPQMIANSAN